MDVATVTLGTTVSIVNYSLRGRLGASPSVHKGSEHMTSRLVFALLGGLLVISMSIDALAAGGPRGGGGNGGRGGGYTQSAPRPVQPGVGTAAPRDNAVQSPAPAGQRPGGYGRATGPRDGSGPGSGPRDGSGPNHVEGQPSRWDRQSQ